MVYADGAIYDGQWKAGKREGNGKFKNLEGKVEVGFWHEDKLIPKEN